MSTRRQVQQFIYSLGYRDAVGTHTLETRRALVAAGLGGSVWAEEVHQDMLRHAKPPELYFGRRSLRGGEADIALYQASAGSNGVLGRLLARPEPKVVYYHNITPSRFFDAWAPPDALNLAWGREELTMLAPHVGVAMANSEFSAADLRTLGIPDVRVIPPYLPPTLGCAPNPTHARWLRQTKRGIDVLFVSRVMPHKGHVHLLRTLAVLRAAIDPEARLFVVGGWGPPAYLRALFRARERLNLEGVVFTGSVSESTLAAHYQEADVFLCMSEHEGFGLPLVEAMRQELPVVAYACGAVAETLGGAGVLLPSLDPHVAAEAIGRVGQEASLREGILRGQRHRVAAIQAIPRDRMIVQAVLDGAASKVPA